MSDESKAHDLGVLSTSPHIESPSTFALAGDDASAPNPANLAKSKGGTPSSSKKKRGRKASVQNNRPPSAGPDSEDINFHVEAGWSEDEADTKEHPAKRVATTADKDAAAAAALAKRATGPLSNFTVRAVVTRKDVEVVFGQEKDKQALLEAQTSTKIEIITGKDDPDIVVDRVLSIKGPIDGVAAAYKDVVESLRKANAASTAPAATVSATAVTASASPPAPTESPSAEADEASKGALPTGNAEPSVDTNANASAADETAQLELPTKEGAASSSVATTVKAASNVCVILRLLVPHRCVGSIMGHSGRTINNIRDVTSVSIHTSEATLPISTERIVEISGSPESIQRAIVLIAEALTRDMANAAPPTLNYGGYAVPAPTLYPTYVVPNAAATGHIGGVVPPAMRYGGAVGAMAPGPARGAYGDSYNGAPSSYQYPAPAAYGYGVPPAAQGMYGGASEQSPNAPYSQAYPERNNRQQMPQPSMPMGGNSGNLPMGGGGGAPPGAGSQTIQQIYVPGDKIGAVIGRRGETINEIRRTTNAHVDIQDSGPGAKQRLIIITGGYDQVRSAYYMIKNKVDMARPAVHS
ncbi:PAB1 binding protein [Coemansia spiralis]|uniref:PAB1 binding protein n=1 Tax=Coemansia spiralis TaxID=417178 RepID=A0A9W8GHF9_9FUNG|nr:PAB1 binding protein [Coemansia spiralis]